MDKFIFYWLIPSVLKIASLFITVKSDSIFFMPFFIFPEKRILAGFEAHFLEFKCTSNILVMFVIYVRATDLFTHGHSLTHPYTPHNIVGRSLYSETHKNKKGHVKT